MSHPEKRHDDLVAEREILGELVPPDPSRPLYTWIRTTFIERYAEYNQLLRDITSNRPQAEAPTSPDELERLDKECAKLTGLLFSRSNVWAARDWRKPDIVKRLLRDIGRKRGGRPISKLRGALEAKELRLSNPKRWTWPALTAEFCDCGKDHTIQCQDNLRREVLHLEKALGELGCPIDLGETP